MLHGPCTAARHTMADLQITPACMRLRRYLATKRVSRKNFQLVGAACLWVAGECAGVGGWALDSTAESRIGIFMAEGQLS